MNRAADATLILVAVLVGVAALFGTLVGLAWLGHHLWGIKGVIGFAILLLLVMLWAKIYIGLD